MKKWLVGAMIGLIAASFAFDAEAQRRLGGGKTFGRQSQQLQQQRQMTPPQQSPQQAAPAQQATNPAAAGAATTKAASPWRGALMGLAAGLGLAALASWLGFGETLATILTVLLIGLAIALVIGFVLRRLRGPQPAYSTPGAPAREQPIGYDAQPAPIARTAIEPATAAARPGSAMDEFMRSAPSAPRPWGVPAGFDAEGFLANAKSYYGRLQAAWDKGDLDELAEFTTHEMFTALTHELRARGGGTSRTEIVALDAALLGIETSATDHLASVRFTGTLRVDGETEPVDEVWNLVKPVDGKTGWLLAGIQQLS